MITTDKLYKIRHTTAHVMAEAVLTLFPQAKIAIGPPIDNGFYYDFDIAHRLNEEDMQKIEERMRTILLGKHSLSRAVVSKDEARKLFQDQPYKLELIDELPNDVEISTYTVDTFVDLCKGPHVNNTEEIHPQAFKLLSVAGAYWRGNEKLPMLQRIYGTAWETPKALREHLNWLAEVAKRDHRKLGRALDLFSIHEEAGTGLIYWHPKGARVRQAIEDFWRAEHQKGKYDMLYTPHIGKRWLWETSGHLEFYQENMYSPMELDNAEYFAKPMNCPFHILIYQTQKRSYRDLPLRWGELGTVYRYERSGVMHGLLRVRGFTQDDAHIFCTPEQVEHEILEVLRFSLRIWQAFGFQDIQAYLSTKPKKAVGKESDWVVAIESLRKALDVLNMPYEIDEGGGAFYGPKIDLKIKDALQRQWQMSTIQFDFNLPHRFGMTFVDKDGKEKTPFMVHRALLGSLERFFGILIEHYAGAFPLWLAPVKGIVIPVAPIFNEYAQYVSDELKEYRITADLSENRLNAKIRNAQKEKIPYMLVVGEVEQNLKQVSIRLRSKGRMDNMSIADFKALLKEQIDNRVLLEKQL